MTVTELTPVTVNSGGIVNSMLEAVSRGFTVSTLKVSVLSVKIDWKSAVTTIFELNTGSAVSTFKKIAEVD